MTERNTGLWLILVALFAISLLCSCAKWEMKFQTDPEAFSIPALAVVPF